MKSILCMDCKIPIKGNSNLTECISCAVKKDGGTLVVNTGGTKYDNDKIRLELLSPIALIEVGKVMTFGAKKYDDHNWRKGIKSSRLIGAMMRHLFAYLGGQDKDPETGISHIAHAMCCGMFLLEQEVTRPDLDDRYKPSSDTSLDKKNG